MQSVYAFKALDRKHSNAFKYALPALRVEFKDHERKHKRQRTLVPMYNVLCALYKNPGRASSEGDKRLASVRRLLDAFPETRSPDQCRFHEDFIRLCLPHIYGADFEINRMRLMNQFLIDYFKVGSLTLTPRRWGKTTAVAMFIAVILFVCEGCTIATFSFGQRASSSLMAKVKKNIMSLENGVNRIVSTQQECMQIAIPSMVDATGRLKHSAKHIIDAGKVNKLFAYPASTKGEFAHALFFPPTNAPSLASEVSEGAFFFVFDGST